MKVKVNNYLFNKDAKTVTFTDYASIRLDGILLITNVTRNIIIYNFASPEKGGSVTNNVLSLTYDTTSMNNGDKLQIFYDDDSLGAVASEGAQNEQTSLIETLQELNARLSVLAGMANAGQPALRTIPIAAITTPVTLASTQVSAWSGIPSNIMAWALQNSMAVQSNINNVTV